MAVQPAPVRWAEVGGYVLALAGLMAVISIVAAPGAPYVLSLGLMVLALAPVMRGFYELGGRMPESPARIALTVGILATIVFAALMAALGAGLVTFDESRAATGAFAISAICMLLFGGWLAGAAALAGAWLTPVPRWLGVVCGVGWVLAGVGLLVGGSEHPLTAIGGIGYQLLFPIWGLVIGRRFTALRSETTRPPPI